MAYIRHEDLCGAFKGNYFKCSIVVDVFLWRSHWQSHTPFPSLACPSSSGDTLLAIRAPIGTQLEVPIPESVSYVRHFLRSLGPATVLSLVSDWVYVFLSRSSTDRGNTRSVSRVHLVPSRFCWSIRTRPVPLLLFCPSLLQMTSFKTSQRQHLPLSRSLLPPRSISFLYAISSIYVSVYCERRWMFRCLSILKQ